MVEVWLPYGTSEVAVRVPEETLIDILRPQTISYNTDPVADLKRLIGSNTDFQAIIKRGETVCVAVGRSRNKKLLEQLTLSLVQELNASGVSSDKIRLLLTPDSPLSETELGTEINVIRHSMKTSPTTQVSRIQSDFVPAINSILMDAPTRIIVGELHPNSALGFSGLSDIIFPELGSEASIQQEISGRKPMIPADLHKERLDIAYKLPHLYALGFVLNEDRSLARMAFESFQICVKNLEELLREYCTRTVEKLADIVIISAGGKPTDETLLRAVEYLPSALSILKRNGAIIVAAECSAGHGNTEFHAWSSEKKEARHLDARLRHAFNLNGWKAACLARAVQNHRVYLISTIPDHHVESAFGLKPAKTVNAALLSAQRALGNDSKISVIPDPTAIISQLKTLEKKLETE
ncbi:MAG TPA: lactate racemase domain-containing protein [Candidatus Saccharimonadales bacterium]|nr:lactate racemase domain-containing protein [Candidatus Saccharimonadales bacterium]